MVKRGNKIAVVGFEIQILRSFNEGLVRFFDQISLAILHANHMFRARIESEFASEVLVTCSQQHHV